MNEPRSKPPAAPEPRAGAAHDPLDEDRPVKPKRPPTVDDFIIDRDKTDPLRRFRF